MCLLGKVVLSLATEEELSLWTVRSSVVIFQGDNFSIVIVAGIAVSISNFVLFSHFKEILECEIRKMKDFQEHGVEVKEDEEQGVSEA